MFGDYQMTNIAPSAMKDDKNAWLQDHLYVAFNEAENDNYTDKEVNSFVKRSTSVEGSSRAMYKMHKKGRFYALALLNTNDAGLHGLSRSDDATKRRIVIMMFKPNDSTVDWNSAKAIVEDISFRYSLYKYMHEEYNISNDYDPTRYDDDFDVWTKLHSLKPVPIESFNEYLKLDRNELHHDFKKPDYNIVQKHFSKGGDFKFYYICWHKTCDEFLKHLQYYPKNRSMNPELIKKGMLELGWTYDRKKSINNKERAVLFRNDFDEGNNEIPVKSTVDVPSKTKMPKMINDPEEDDFY
jgi:hypothetical protein